MTRSVISLVLTMALMAAAAAGCKAKDQGPGPGGEAGSGEVAAEPIDPSEVPEDMLSKLMEGAPEKLSAKTACVRLWLGKTAYMCCAWSGNINCQPLKSTQK